MRFDPFFFETHCRIDANYNEKKVFKKAEKKIKSFFQTSVRETQNGRKEEQ